MKTDTFVHRHIGPNEEEIQFMLNKIGAVSIDQLLEETLPSSIRLKSPLPIEKGISEYAFSKHIHQLGKENDRFDTYIGMGYHAAITPAVIQRNVLENPGWYTAYTPYQAEIAQGRLEALFNFQSLITDLTGMELANASLLDESTAAAEAMTMLFGTRTKEQKQAEATHFFVDENTLPQTLSLLQTRALPLGITLVVGSPDTHEFDAHFFGAIFQYPGKHGAIPNLKQWIEKANTKGVFTVVAADIMSLVLLESPGHYGADVVVGTSQRFGIPLGYGGPHAAFFATREHYKRNIPGRIIGQTRDLDENPALRMALQTREQHIKRDRATSNICTAQVLLAVMAGMYAVYHGPKGLRAIAEGIHKHTVLLNNNLIALRITQKNDHFFDTLHCEVRSAELKTLAEQKEINFYYPDANSVSISINETTTEEDVLKIVSVFKQYLQKDHLPEAIPASSSFLLGERKTSYLTHPVFNSYHSETALMRYIKSLERKDLALNQSMISLGSCTMKLNAATEMFPLSDPNWGAIHPFVPIEQAKGYQKMLTQLSDDLTKITGFAATSLQPNSGAQGEYAGLMVIRAFHEANKQSHRTICLIPASAHGTNPASAVMAGM